MSHEYKIEKGLTPPTTRPRGKFPFPEMEVGDSFLIADPCLAEKKAVSSAAYNWGIRNNAKFSGRTTKDGFRVWRVE